MRFRRYLLTVVLGIGLSGCQGAVQPGLEESASVPLAHSRVTRLDITSHEPAFGGRSFGAVGAYEILLGTATAVADPHAPLNAGIVDLENAPRNTDGLVEYTFEFDMLKPVDITRGNGVLVYEINNRGRNIVFGYFHEAGRGYAAEHAGNEFLMNQGYTYVSSGWLDGAPGSGNPRPVLANLPPAMDNGRTITGMSMEEWQDPDSAAFGRLTYPAVTLEKSAATLTHRQLQNDPRRTVPADQWYYVDDMTVAVTPPAGTDAGTIYEFVYQVQNPIVLGLGFSAMRDFVAFARHSPADDQGAPNPLFVDGMPVLDHVVAVGSSQSGRMVRDFVYQGFNEDTDGRRVFDGMTPYVAGARRTFVNARFAQTGRYTRQHEDHNYPMDEFPFTFATTTESADGQDRRAAGRLHGLEHLPEHHPGGRRLRVLRRPRVAHPDRHNRPAAGAAAERALLDARDRASAGQRRVPRPGQPGAAVAVLPGGVRRDGAVGAGRRRAAVHARAVCGRRHGGDR